MYETSLFRMEEGIFMFRYFSTIVTTFSREVHVRVMFRR